MTHYPLDSAGLIEGPPPLGLDGGRPAAMNFLVGGGEMGRRIREMDWSKTSIGPVERWSLSLRTMVSIMLANRFPLLLWWGPDYVSIYNDAYRPVLGAKHPWALGTPVRECWSEIWDVLKPLIDAPFQGGPPTWSEDLSLELNRHGFLEETHFTVAYSPVPDESAPTGIGGVLATVHEITDKIVGERRIIALRDVGARSGEAKTAEEACAIAISALDGHGRDAPFAALYLFDDERKSARLVGATGVVPDESAAPSSISLEATAGAASPWPVAALLESGGTIVVERLPQLFSKLPSGPWSDPPHTAVLAPIKSSAARKLAGFLIAGVSPRLRLDEQYRSFFELLASGIATVIAAARAYEEERKRAEALAEIDRAKTLFFSNVSHEFRTPLTLMLGPLEDALAAPLPEAQRQQLDLAHRNSLRLLKLVNSLLDFSRIEAGRTQALFEATDLATFTAQLASNFRSACERAGLQLIVDCTPLPEPVHVDRDMWEKIVLNLLSNAFKFTFEGEIAVRLQAAEGSVELSVRDTGVGVPEHELPRLFERFHRIEGQKSRTYEGSGIGLALVQELVKLHDGDIRVESRPGRGATFTVTVPFGRARLSTVDAAQKLATTSVRVEAYVQEALRWLPDGPSSADNLATDSTGPAQFGDGARIVLADDNADMRAYLRRVLGPNYDVEAFVDGQDALEAIRRRRPDLLITDVMMPRLDGLQLVRAIRDDPALRELPIVMLSARAGEDSRVEGLEAGADDYLAKPFSARELVARVSANLKLAKVRRQGTKALRESERRYRESDEQLRAYLSTSFDVVYRMSADWSIMRHLEGKEFISDTTEPSGAWLEKYIHLDDQACVMEAIQRAIRTKSVFELEHRVLRVDGTLGWTFSRAVPLLDPKGEIIEWLGTAADVTARKQYDERQKLLLNELNHRVKNTLAAVQSIAIQTLRGAPTTEGALHALQTRLFALSSAHDVLTREQWEGADIFEIIQGSVGAYRTRGQEARFIVEGPDIRLLPKAALALSLALHELATNAAKYGALSNDMGRVHVGWSITADPPAFSFRWVERDGPPVETPRRRGFGSRLIERGLAQDLQGDIRLEFAPTGVICTIAAPIEEIGRGPIRRAT